MKLKTKEKRKDHQLGCGATLLGVFPNTTAHLLEIRPKRVLSFVVAMPEYSTCAVILKKKRKIPINNQI